MILNKEKMDEAYISKSVIDAKSEQSSIMWAIAGATTSLWAVFQHPSIIFLLVPLVVGAAIFIGANDRAKTSMPGMLEVPDIIGLSVVTGIPLLLIEIALIVANIRYPSFWQGIIPLAIIIFLWIKTSDGKELSAKCYLCHLNHPLDGPKTCPSCGCEFENGGWGDFKMHWNHNHAEKLSYNDVWDTLCDGHRKLNISFVDPRISSYRAQFRSNDEFASFKEQTLAILNMADSLIICLENHGITHIHQLIQLSEEQLLELKEIGQKRVHAIKKSLTVHGLSLSSDIQLIAEINPVKKTKNEINFLRLSKRTANVLASYKIITVGDLVDLGEARIRFLPGVGSATFDEIARVLIKHKIWVKVKK